MLGRRPAAPRKTSHGPTVCQGVDAADIGVAEPDAPDGADIISDGVLIDIKTAKKQTFRLENFRQLAGYATLRRLAGGPDFREVGGGT